MNNAIDKKKQSDKNWLSSLITLNQVLLLLRSKSNGIELYLRKKSF